MNNLHNNNRPTTSTGGGVPGAYGACGGGIVGGLLGGGSGGGGNLHVPTRAPPSSSKVVKRKCVEVMCQPSVIFLGATVVVTAVATVLLSIAITTRYWEQMKYDPERVTEIVGEGNRSRSVQWLLDGRLPLITYERPGENELVYLFPVKSGVWISCIDLEEYEFDKLTQAGYKDPRCEDHLSPEATKPKDARAAWQFRMQNLAIACAMVCLILLGSAILVGLFGVFRNQNSAILVTGVIYVLAALFAIFTLALVHVKHRNRDDHEPLDVWTRLIPDMDNTEDFRLARVITLGWSLHLAWGGVGVCLLASVMWMSVSKMIRYNPISLVT